MAPYNLSEAPPTGFTRDTASVRVIYVTLPAPDEAGTRSSSWSKAATVALLPERFVLLGYQGSTEVLNELGVPVQTPLQVSPDPRTDPESQFQFDADGNLTLGEELRWMVDFDEAVRRGMGFRVTLSASQSRGFDRLFVLGVRYRAPTLRAAPRTSRTCSRTIISASPVSRCCRRVHRPTTPRRVTRPTRAPTIPIASFDFVFKDKARFAETDDWLDKADGQWFAEALGLDTDWLTPDPECRRGRSIRGARDEHRAVARHARILHGHTAQARV